MTKQEVLGAIKDFSKEFPKEAILEIRENIETFIPELLNSLDFVYQNARELHNDRSNYFLYIYAMYLLAEFREKRAFPHLLALLRLPEDEISYILGDRLTESFHRILLSTFDNENIQMLLDVIENHELYEWARQSAVGAYELLIREGFVSTEESVSYLRSLIYGKLPPDDSSEVFTAIVGCVIDARLVDMIPDVRFLYDNGRVDASVHGEYDDFIDWIFNQKHPTKTYIDDAISEMEWWACFKSKDGNSGSGSSKRSEKSLFDMFDKMKKAIQQESIIENTPKKTGRNEPCPCGSGKKYKKCCIDAQHDTSIKRIEDKYNLLEMYPKDSALFEQMFEKEAIEIDILVYKALNHREIPLWEKRDMEQERIGKINYLNEALTLFLDKCQQAQITSFSAYDKQFMIHYRSNEWVSALIGLIEDSDSEKMKAIRQSAKDALKKLS